LAVVSDRHVMPWTGVGAAFDGCQMDGDHGRRRPTVVTAEQQPVRVDQSEQGRTLSWEGGTGDVVEQPPLLRPRLRRVGPAGAEEQPQELVKSIDQNGQGSTAMRDDDRKVGVAFENA
jgi:hypothetical protein